MIAKNLAVLFRQSVSSFPQKKALFYKESGKYQSITWSEFQKKVEAVAQSLYDRGFRSGDRLAILSENRPEWAIVDMAAQHLGVGTVPIYTSLASSEIQTLLGDSGAKMVAVSDNTLLEKILVIQKNLPDLTGIIGFESSLIMQKNEVSVPLYFLKDWERTSSQALDLDAHIQLIAPDAIASIIYTPVLRGSQKA